MIARGGGYDAVLRWRAAGPEDDIKGYTIVLRPTTSPYWEQEIYVGKVASVLVARKRAPSPIALDAADRSS